MKLNKWIAIGTTLAIAPAVLAHPGHIHSGLLSGAAHPFTGLDHMLAMIAVGMWAVRQGGNAIWRLPLTFIGVMVLGGALSKAGVPMPAVESSIAASVLVLGLALAFWSKPPTWVALSLVGLFAVFHGYAHMSEIASGSGAASYAVGFVFATAALHAIGIAVALIAGQFARVDVMRWVGAAIACCGAVLCVGAIF